MPGVSFKEIKNFKHRINPEERQGAYGYYFFRPWSILFTYLALNLGLSANQVTALQAIVGVVGAACFAFPSYKMALAGIVLLQFGYLLDNVDGEVARFRKQVSVTGKFLDTIGHVTVIPCIYFFLGVGSYFRLGHFETIIFGFLAGLFTLRFDISTLYQEAAQLLESKLDRNFDYYASAQTKETQNLYRRKNEESPIRLLYAIFAYPAIMNIISVLLLADWVLGPWRIFNYQISLVYLFLILYGTLLPLRRAFTIYLLVRNRETENKYNSLAACLAEKSEGKVQD